MEDDKEKYYIQDGDRIVAQNVDLEAEDHDKFGIEFSPASDGTFLENAEFYYYDSGNTEELYLVRYDEDYKPFVELPKN